MVKSLLLSILLACGTARAASLSAQLDRTTAALGEPLSLTVQAQGLSLDALDVTPLEMDFEVFSRTLSRSADSETLVLTLYARRPGALRLPALTLESRRTREQTLTVSDGSESVPRVTSRWMLEPAQPQVGQPVRLSLAICDDGSLQWQRPALPTRSGRSLRALGEDEGDHAGEACTLHRFHWALLATTAGTASIDLPVLDAGRFGQRLRFPGPTLEYQAAPLPAWLPAHVAPVAPRIQADPLPARWPLGRPLGWRFEVTGGYSADGLKALLAMQLRESAALGLYPPLVEAAETEDPNSPLTRHVVTLFWQPRASGELSLPTLRLPWYDPARGLMNSTSMEGGKVAVFDPRWRRAGQILGGLTALLLLAGLFWQGRRMLLWRVARWRGLRAIRAATDIPGLARAVRGFSLSGQPAAVSLRAWQRQLQMETGGCDVVEVVSQLEQQFFGRADFGLDSLQSSLLRVLSGARPKSRSLVGKQP